MGGVPSVRGTRIPVTTVVGLLAENLTVEGVLALYPQLPRRTSGPAGRTPRLMTSGSSVRP